VCVVYDDLTRPKHVGSVLKVIYVKLYVRSLVDKLKPVNSPSFDNPNDIGEQYRSLSCLLCSLLHSLVTYFGLGPKYAPQGTDGIRLLSHPDVVDLCCLKKKPPEVRCVRVLKQKSGERLNFVTGQIGLVLASRNSFHLKMKTGTSPKLLCFVWTSVFQNCWVTEHF